MTNEQECERCGSSERLYKVKTTRGAPQQVMLCAKCVQASVRAPSGKSRGTNYQVEK